MVFGDPQVSVMGKNYIRGVLKGLKDPRGSERRVLKGLRGRKEFLRLLMGYKLSLGIFRGLKRVREGHHGFL